MIVLLVLFLYLTEFVGMEEGEADMSDDRLCHLSEATASHNLNKHAAHQVTTLSTQHTIQKGGYEWLLLY